MITKSAATSIGDARADEANKLDAMAFQAKSTKLRRLLESAARSSRTSSSAFYRLADALPEEKKTP